MKITKISKDTPKVVIPKGYCFTLRNKHIFTDIQRLDKVTAYNLLALLNQEGILNSDLSKINKDLLPFEFKQLGSIYKDITCEYKVIPGKEYISYSSNSFGGAEDLNNIVIVRLE